MIRQDFPLVPIGKSASKRQLSKKPTSDNERNHIWEVRHAGLLGIKYEVAVRNDIFDSAGDIKQEDGDLLLNQEGKNVLRDVVDVAILGYVEILSLVLCILISLFPGSATGMTTFDL
jgi:TATA-binding protein-associated factor